jgi:hypothetical protein
VRGLKGALIPIVALTRGFPLAPFGWSGTPRGFPWMADGSLLRSGGETWGQCRQTMFTKQVSGPSRSQMAGPRNRWSGAEAEFSHPSRSEASCLAGLRTVW